MVVEDIEQTIEGELEWTERPIFELVKRYADFYYGLTEKGGVPGGFANIMTCELIKAEQSVIFPPGLLPEIIQDS